MDLKLSIDLLLILAILAVGVVYGVYAFFAVIGRSALAQSSDAAIADVMGHLHRVANVRIPSIGATAIVTTLAFAIVVGVGTRSSWLALLAVAGLK